MSRLDGRSADQLRPITITPDIYPQAAGSVLFRMGTTQILAAVTLTQGVPPFLRNSGTGWLTAEYSMLPASTSVRTTRETAGCKRNGRNVEIARIIGRAFRAVVDFKSLGERTINIDCDVISADGGTRVASICAAQYALLLAQQRWLDAKIITKPVVQQIIAATAVGLAQDGQLLVDLTAQEDNQIASDYNFVLSSDGAIVELQGTAELKPMQWAQLQQMYELARNAAGQIMQHYPEVK